MYIYRDYLYFNPSIWICWSINIDIIIHWKIHDKIPWAFRFLMFEITFTHDSKQYSYLSSFEGNKQLINSFSFLIILLYEYHLYRRWGQVHKIKSPPIEFITNTYILLSWDGEIFFLLCFPKFSQQIHLVDKIGCHHLYFWNRIIFIFEKNGLGTVIRLPISIMNQIIQSVYFIIRIDLRKVLFLITSTSRMVS